MQEVELKFQVPAERRLALARAVATSTAQTVRLQAVYADTADRRLAQAGLALRLRKEGRLWVQTLKGRGDGLMQRLEHEVPLPAQRGVPLLDPARHDGTPAGQALRAALRAGREEGAEAAELLPIYRTDITRVQRRVRHAGAVIEIAHDRGRLIADERTLPVDEIEFELKSGPPQALVALAARWAERFGLWWDVRTKSERGYRLALGMATVPAVRAQRLALPPGDATAPVWQAVLQACLAQALPNLAEIAGAEHAGGPDESDKSDESGDKARAEHLHQLRVALRRLRTALRLFADWGPDPVAARALEAACAGPFERLGTARDRDVLVGHWLPRLAKDGAPALPLPPALPDAALDAAARDPMLAALLLRALSLSLPVPPALPAPSAVAPLRFEAARMLLRHAWRLAWADAAVFADAPLAQRHRARKRLKRLRYATEFLLSLMPAKPARRWLRRLGVALEALGEGNDLAVALEHFEAQAAQDPRAWFAVGWLRAQQAPLQARALAALAALDDTPRPWRGLKA